MGYFYGMSNTFIERSKIIHNNKYCYEQVNYRNTDTKVIILCPIHGPFEQRPEKHLIGQGCPKCKGTKISSTSRMGKERFINKANQIHNNKYDYSLVEYINYHTKVLITCQLHGQFPQTPNNHLYDKNGCPKCSCNSISTSSQKWLDSLNIIVREYHIPNTKFVVDGFDIQNNTVYEYLGCFWHGCPTCLNPNDIHPRLKKTHLEIYEYTKFRLQTIENLGYKIITKWEHDYIN